VGVASGVPVRRVESAPSINSMTREPDEENPEPTPPIAQVHRHPMILLTSLRIFFFYSVRKWACRVWDVLFDPGFINACTRSLSLSY
jgi:hypothetical protein